MKITIADDHSIFRDTLTFLISQKTPHKVISELESIEAIIPSIQNAEPELILMDYHMPGGDALATAEYIKARYEGIKIIFLTGTQSGFILKHLSESDVDGVLHKTDDAATILDAIEQVSLGNRVIASSVSEKVEQDELQLTNREFQIFSLIMKGLSSKEIGETVNIASRTVDKHKENIMKKAKVNNTVQLVELGHRLQILDIA